MRVILGNEAKSERDTLFQFYGGEMAAWLAYFLSLCISEFSHDISLKLLLQLVLFSKKVRSHLSTKQKLFPYSICIWLKLLQNVIEIPPWKVSCWLEKASLVQLFHPYFKIPDWIRSQRRWYFSILELTFLVRPTQQVDSFEPLEVRLMTYVLILSLLNNLPFS